MTQALFPVTLDGVDYPARVQALLRQTLPSTREQADQSNEFGEQTLNPADLWRRSQTDWRNGAGQDWLDKDPEDSAVRRQFDTSFGIDPWDRGELKLLKAVVNRRALASNALGKMVVAGTRLYVVDGTSQVSYTTNGTAWTAISFASYGTINDIASNGHYIWVACTDGLYYVTTSSNTVTLRTNLSNPETVAWVKGRLMVTAGSDIYNVVDSSTTAAPDPLTPAALDTQFTWDCFGETGNFILAAGHAGDKSLIYRITIRQDGTALDAPTVAAPLPDGELVHSILGYVGVVLIGTSLGLRVAPGNSGAVNYGPLVEIGQPVRCLEPQDRFAWFGWQNPDGTRTGLGRVDLSVFVEELQPAYATDLLATGQGAVTGVVTFLDHRWFAVPGVGIFEESTSYVTEGEITSGRITFGIPDGSIVQKLQVRNDALGTGESVDYEVTVDGSVVASGSISSGTGTDPEASVSATAGDVARVTLTLRGDGSSTPVVTRWTLRALPIPRRGREWMLELVMQEQCRDATGRNYQLDVAAMLAHLEQLEQGTVMVDLTMFGETHSVYCDQLAYGPDMNVTRSGNLVGPVRLRVRSFPDV